MHVFPLAVWKPGGFVEWRRRPCNSLRPRSDNLKRADHLCPQSAAAAATQTQQVECVSRRLEAQDIVTFEFRAPLGLSYKPGMYASFDLEVRLICKIWGASTALKAWRLSGMRHLW